MNSATPRFANQWSEMWWHLRKQFAERVLNQMPAGDAGAIDAAMDEAEAAILYLEEQRDNLLDAIQTGSSSALAERLKTVEKELTELTKDHEELLIQQADAA